MRLVTSVLVIKDNPLHQLVTKELYLQTTQARLAQASLALASAQAP
ncbi:hypothetical protein [Pseudomonas glycinae]|nr:hypothetical protein [Pseudomonas glycinae]